MEEDQQETEFCSNCKKDIPANNFVMHVPHCHRNIILCASCKEPVPKSQKDEHFEEFHTKVKCKCGESMEKMHLEEHKGNDCQSRSTVCEYCELELTVKEIDSHKEYCGSRTELCETCNKRIQHRDLEEHLLLDCSLDKNNSTANNATHVSSRSHNGVGRRLPEEMVRNFGGPEAYRSLFTAGLETFPARAIFEEDQYFDMYPFNMVPRDNVVARGPFSNHTSRREPRREISHHIDVDNEEVNLDGDTLERENLEEDELMAALLASDNDRDFNEHTCGGFKEPLPGINHLHNHHDMHYEDQGEDLDETVLPCEFCGQPIKVQDLIQHQTGCQLTSSNSPVLYPQLRSQPYSLPPLEPDDDSDDNEEHNDDIEQHDETFLPCEFCQELFPSDSLIGHQSICDSQGSRPPSVIHTFQGTFNEPGLQPPNNTRPQTRSRPPRPNRPVVIGDRSDEQHMNLFNEESDLRPSRANSNGSIGSGERHMHLSRQVADYSRGTYSNGNNNDRHVSDIPSQNSRPQRNNDVHSHRRGAASSSVPLTVRNKQVSQGATTYNRKTMNTTRQRHPSDLSRASRVPDEGEKKGCVVALPKPDSHVGWQETRNNSPENDHEQSAFSMNGRFRNVTRIERNGGSPLELRPLQESGVTQSSSANQRPPKMGLPQGTRQFNDTTHTRKQVRRLAPSFDQQQTSTGNGRKESSKMSSERRNNDQRTTERGAQGTSGRARKSKKKIV